MPALHGKKIVMFIQTDPDVATTKDTEVSGLTGYTEFTGYVHTARLSQNRDTAESTVFGENDKEYVPGLKHGTITMDQRYNAAKQAILTTALGTDTPSLVIFRPEGSVATKEQYSGSYFLTGTEIGGDTNSVQGGPINFQRTGALVATPVIANT